MVEHAPADAVFVDTSAWYALFVSTDPSHARAVATYERLKAGAATLACTDWVLLETTALLTRRVGPAQARQAAAAISGNARLELLWMDEELGSIALERFQAAPHGVSLVDVGSFVVMEKGGITRAFAFGQDFTSAGYSIDL
ncbi:MAG: PIN domain-containing protein [Nitrospirae bacterium]|nr:PIN domain-containing protein [Nitrospirota bacterium]